MKTKAFLKPAVLFTGIYLLFTQAHASTRPAQEYFVERDGNRLVCNGKPYYFSAGNSDHLFYSSHFMIDDELGDAAALGLTAFRTWASSEGQSSWKDGYCFQPDPGQYDENTFRQMDYIIAKAREKGVRLILPFVNNWDDGFGGMQQYVKWCLGDIKDWSDKTTLKFDLYNEGDALTVDVAIKTGTGWVWHESEPTVLTQGWNHNITYDLTNSRWKTEASGWKYTSPLDGRDLVQGVCIGVFGYLHSGAVYIDNIRLDTQVYDGLEYKDNWRAGDYSHATNVELSSAHVSEGTRSLKMSYSYSSGEYNKAFAEKQPQADKNLFYADAQCKGLFKQYISYFLNRVNSITGIAYKNDPAILMWELANEPRCESDPTGDTLQAWIEEISGYIKQIDPNHLVGTGEEGWYSIPGGPNWRFDGILGVDFIRNHQTSSIDICSFHLYPEGYDISDNAALQWIQKHVDDAHTLINKPVFLGEFGIAADRKAVILNDFSADTQNWSADWNCTAGPTRVVYPSRDGNGSISYTVAIGPVNTRSAGRVIYPGFGMDFSVYNYLSGWIYIPASAPADLTAELYVSTGTSWIWASGKNVPLVPGAWTQVKLTEDQAESWGADMSKVRCLGMQVKRGDTDYNGDVYYDLIGANLQDIYDAGYQMSRRNNLYCDWLALSDKSKADGAGFWQLLARQDPGELYPDYWGWGVYYPEDYNTSDIIGSFSTSMKYKSGALEGPSVSARLNANQQTDLIIGFGVQHGAWLYRDNSAWTFLHTKSPKLIAAGRLNCDPDGKDDLVMDFGSEFGIWIYYDNSTWAQINNSSSESITTADLDGNGQDEVIIDFGYKYGVWVYYNNSTWAPLHGISPKAIIKARLDNGPKDDLVIDFGPQYGIWIYYNNSDWQYLHNMSSGKMVVGDLDNNGRDDVIIDFGDPYGIWVYYNNSVWSQLHNVSPDLMAVGNVNVDPRKDLIVDFGPQYGIWIYLDNTTWAFLHQAKAGSLLTGDMNGNGMDEIIVDFGAQCGLWVRNDDGAWWQLNTVSP